MFSAEVEIARPVREVYEQFKDPDNLPHWLSGLQRLEPISGTPAEVGAVSRQVYLEKGRVVELIETITAVEPEQHFAGRIEGQGIEAALFVDFVDKGDRTVVKFRSDFKSKGLMMKLMLPFMKGHVQERQKGDLERFKEFVEAQGS